MITQNTLSFGTLTSCPVIITVSALANGAPPAFVDAPPIESIFPAALRLNLSPCHHVARYSCQLILLHLFDQQFAPTGKTKSRVDLQARTLHHSESFVERRSAAIDVNMLRVNVERDHHAPRAVRMFAAAVVFIRHYRATPQRTKRLRCTDLQLGVQGSRSRLCRRSLVAQS